MIDTVLSANQVYFSHTTIKHIQVDSRAFPSFTQTTMKAVILLAIFAVAIAVEQLVSDELLIKEINSHPRATWTAGENAIFKGKTMSQIRNMFGAFLLDKENTLEKFSYDNATAPAAFDSRTQWPQCNTIRNIRNQGQCGSCWAFSATEVMSDRFCIASQATINKLMSPQDMVSCDSGDYGCQGGYLNKLWEYYANTGTVTDSCFPYASFGGQVPACPTACAPGSADPWHKYKTQPNSAKNFADINSAMADIAAKGPIQTGFKVYRDFFSYKSGVYRHVSGGFAGGHVCIIIVI